MMKKLLFPAMLLLVMAACKNDDPNPTPGGGDEPPAPIDTVTYEPGVTPEFHYSVAPWDGTVASDIAADMYDPADEDNYHENTEWEQVVTVTYSGSTATVTGNSAPVSYTIDGAHVDLKLSSVKAKVVATGSSADGSLRITGDHRHMLTLDALKLTSLRGPAINDQDRKRVFLHLEGDSYLEDVATYQPAASSLEDRKGCFFSEGHVILSGSGVLHITGKYRHGLATDGYLLVRPGVTLVVDDAAKNAIHVKGGSTTGFGVKVLGGYIYANTSAPAGKVLKCDQYVIVNGGTLSLNCSGDFAPDDDNTLSSAACIKAGTYVQLSGGDLSLIATGHGGKGINATGAVTVTGGNTIISCAGDREVGSGDTSTPKGLKTDSNLAIRGGSLSVSAIGEGAIGVEAAGTTTQDGGVVYVFGRESAWLAGRGFTVTDGTLLAGGGAIATPTELTPASVSQSVAVTEAGATMLLVDPLADAVCGTYVWPLAMPQAQFLMVSPDLSADASYDITFIK